MKKQQWMIGIAVLVLSACQLANKPAANAVNIEQERGKFIRSCQPVFTQMFLSINKNSMPQNKARQMATSHCECLYNQLVGAYGSAEALTAAIVANGLLAQQQWDAVFRKRTQQAVEYCTMRTLKSVK